MRVGPSSMTRARLPFTRSGRSQVTGLLARMTRALGFTFAALASMALMSASFALSHLLMRMRSAMRKLASPGW